MAYTFTINATGSNEDIPVNTDLTGMTLKIVLNKGGSAVPVEVTSGLVAGNKTVNLTIPAANVNTFGSTHYQIIGTKGGVDTVLQDGRIHLTVPTDSSKSVVLSGPISLAGPIDTNPHVAGDLIKTVQSKIRQDFPGTAIDATFWDVTTGPGMTVSVANSTLSITSGTTANSQTILRSKQSWSGAYRVMFMSAATLLSQRIANTEVELRVTNNARTSYASWLFNGTTTTTGICRAYNNSTTAGDQSQGSIPATSGQVVFELENFIDEVYFHSRAPESTNGRVTSNVKNRQTPDPGEDMYVEIVVRNLATAPASSTTLTLDAVLIQDISELTTEITAGRGGGGASQSIPVMWPGSQGVNVNNTPNVNAMPNAIWAEYSPVATANLAAGANSQSNIDFGTSVSGRATRLRPIVLHSAGQTHGYLQLLESTDNVTFRQTWSCPIPSDNLYHTFDIPVHLRYARLQFTNGSVAQTGFYFANLAVRTDGNTSDAKANLSFPLTPATGSAIAISTTVNYPAIDLGGNHFFDKARLLVKSDQAGTFFVDESLDGTNWFVVGSGLAVTAGSAMRLEQPITARYIRARAVNGATASTTTIVELGLVTL